MATAHAIVRAYVAIGEANQALKAAGRSPAKVPLDEFVFATRLAKAEVTTCLRQPGQSLINLIRNRSASLAQEEAELLAVLAQEEAEAAALREEIAVNENWGLF